MTKIKEHTYNKKAYAELVKNGFNLVAARVLAARGISNPKDLVPDLSLIKPITGKAQKAAQQIAKAVTDKKKIVVIGDYDADGICSITLAVSALRDVKADVDWLQSMREHQERSLDVELVNQAIKLGAKLIITTDGGTTAYAGVKLASENNIDVIVTDHHLPDKEKEPINVLGIANPSLDEPFFADDDKDKANPEICGTAVVLFVFREVFRLLGVERPIGVYMDLVAIATVADNMRLDTNINRALLLNGINLITKGRCRNAIKAVLGSGFKKCNTTMLKMKVVPMLNSAYRVGSPTDGVKAMLAEEARMANSLVLKLEGYHRQSNQQFRRYYAEALNTLDNLGSSIVVYNPQMPTGLKGWLAARLIARYNVPVAVLCGEKTKIVGSIRSPRNKNISVHKVISKIAKKHPDLLSRWGGHDNAVGIGLSSDGDVEQFRSLFNQYLKKQSSKTKDDVIKTDGKLQPNELIVGTFSKLFDLPWGYKFPYPSFHGDFVINKCTPVINGTGFNFVLEHPSTKTTGNTPVLTTKTVTAWSPDDTSAHTGDKVRIIYAPVRDPKNIMHLTLHIKSMTKLD